MKEIEVAVVDPTIFDSCHEAAAALDHLVNNTHELLLPRPALRDVFSIILSVATGVAIGGVLANASLIAYIIRRGLVSNGLYRLLINLALSNVMKACVGLPLSMIQGFYEFWFFGATLCKLAPLLQTIPIHVSMITYLVIFVHLYRRVRGSSASGGGGFARNPVPIGVCIVTSWLVALILALPGVMYVQESVGPQDFAPTIAGLKLTLHFCRVEVESRYEEYSRGVYIGIYLIPLCLIAILSIVISAELKCRERVALLTGPIASSNSASRCSVRTTMSNMTTNSLISSIVSKTAKHRQSISAHPISNLAIGMNFSGPQAEALTMTSGIGNGNGADSAATENRSRSLSLSHLVSTACSELDLAVISERKSHRHLLLMVLAFSLLWLPVHMLHMFHSTYDSPDTMACGGHHEEAVISYSYVVFPLLGSLCTIIYPMCAPQIFRYGTQF